MDYSDDGQWAVLRLEPSQLPGTGRVADDLYLIAHHETSGKPFLSNRVMGIVLAGGLLAELIATEVQAFSIYPDGLIVPHSRGHGSVVRYARPVELVGARICDLIMQEPSPRPVHDWLLFLGKTATTSVAGRLENAGYLTRPAGRVSWRARWPVPVESNSPRCALLRAHSALDETRPLTQYTALLAGLTVASGLGFRFSELSREVTRGPDALTEFTSFPLQNLIAHLQRAVDAAVLSTRS